MSPTEVHVDPAKFVEGEIVERREITSELWIVRVRPSSKIPFHPGQYVSIALPGAARPVERPYSIASAPDEPELEFFLELVPGGQLTPQLYFVPVGGQVFLRRSAKGRFVLDTKSGRKKHFMVATVTGVAPYVSIARHLSRQPEVDGLEITILQGASHPAEFGYREELECLESVRDWFRYIPTVSRPWLAPRWEGERGRVEDVARKYLDAFQYTPENAVVYLCGNPNMIENMKGVLQRAGFAREQIKEEVYWHAEKE